MAAKKMKIDKEFYSVKNLGIRAGHVTLGVAGGAIGNQITTWLEKQSFLGSFAPHASSITGLIGSAIYVLVPNQFAQAFGFGMAVTGGTEEAEGLIGLVQGSLGISPQARGLGAASGRKMINTSKPGLGFVPRPNTASQVVNYANDVPVR